MPVAVTVHCHDRSLERILVRSDKAHIPQLSRPLMPAMSGGSGMALLCGRHFASCTEAGLPLPCHLLHQPCANSARLSTSKPNPSESPSRGEVDPEVRADLIRKPARLFGSPPRAAGGRHASVNVIVPYAQGVYKGC